MRAIRLEDGRVAFRWPCLYDPRCYIPPKGYRADAELVDHHPRTGKAFREGQWWIFLQPK